MSAPTVFRVTVTAVRDDGTCAVRDGLGKERQIRWDTTRTGMVPAVGETWLIDSSLGAWTLAAKVGWRP